jgi:hypothetical protein
LKKRELEEEVRALKQAPGSKPFNPITRLGGRFPLAYPLLIGLILFIAYRWFGR